jgi:hypothetical protein
VLEAILGDLVTVDQQGDVLVFELHVAASIAETRCVGKVLRPALLLLWHERWHNITGASSACYGRTTSPGSIQAILFWETRWELASNGGAEGARRTPQVLLVLPCVAAARASDREGLRGGGHSSHKTAASQGVRALRGRKRSNLAGNSWKRVVAPSTEVLLRDLRLIA